MFKSPTTTGNQAYVGVRLSQGEKGKRSSECLFPSLIISSRFPRNRTKKPVNFKQHPSLCCKAKGTDFSFISHSSNKQIPFFFLPSLTFLPPKYSQPQISDRQNQNQISIAIHLPYSSRSKKNRRSFRADAVYSKRESRSLLLVVGKGILEILTLILAELGW